MNYIEEKTRKTPVIDEVDVLVVGGGVAGIAAALAAARGGAKTAIIEKNECLGGAISAALMPQISAGAPGLMGIGKELIDEVIKYSSIPTADLLIPIDSEVFKILSLEKLVAAGVQVYLFSHVSDAVMEGNRIKGVIFESKSGRTAILSKVVIDASGDGDISCYAGALYKIGREDKKMRPISLMFKVGNVDIKRMSEYAKQNPKEFAPDLRYHFNDLERGLMRMVGYFSIVKKAKEEGVLFDDCHYIRIEGVIPQQKIAIVNATRVYNVSGVDIRDINKSIVENYEQIKQLMSLLVNRVPGFEDSFLVQLASDLGVRETRHIEGEYIYTVDDIIQNRKFEDTVVHSYKRQFPDQPSHSPDGNEGGEGDTSAHSGSAPILPFDIPYRCLVPKNIDGLLTAGRCISQTHEGDAFTRPQSTCFSIGEAAGVAAGVAVKSGKQPRDLIASGIDEVRKILKDNGVLPE